MFYARKYSVHLLHTSMGEVTLFLPPMLTQPQGFLIFSLAITASSIRGPIPFAILTVLVNCTWLSLTVSNFWTDEFGASNVVFKKIGGVFGLLVSFTAWYLMSVGLMEKR